MRLATIQFCPARGDTAANLNRLHHWISSVDADVIVFPELATCGYFFRSPAEALPYAFERTAPEIAGLVDAAAAAGRVIVCGFAERDGDRLYNSAVIGGKGLATTVYRKSHLFYREVDVFTPGDSGFFVVDLPHLDCRLGTMICYDWRFPESSRSLALKGADLIACPSNLVTEIWRTVMPTRAIENKVYLAVANRTGSETNANETLQFNGCSAIYGYNGKPLANAEADADAVLIAEIDPSLTRNKRFNDVNDIFADRRPELYR